MQNNKCVNEWASTLFSDNYRRLYDLGMLFTSSRSSGPQVVDDAIQEVFCVLIRKADELISHPNIEGWLVVTLRFTLLDQLRKEKKHSIRSAVSFDDEDMCIANSAFGGTFVQEDGFAQLAQEEQRQELEQVLNKKNTDLFYAYCVEGERASIVAQDLGITERAVWTRSCRIQKKLRAIALRIFS